MAQDKVTALVGFAIKAGKIIFGTDAIERSHRKKGLIIACKTLSEGSLEKLVRQSGGTTVILSRVTPVSELTHKNGCKVIAVTDKQMSDAILKNINGNYQILTEVK